MPRLSSSITTLALLGPEPSCELPSAAGVGTGPTHGPAQVAHAPAPPASPPSRVARVACPGVDGSRPVGGSRSGDVSISPTWRPEHGRQPVDVVGVEVGEHDQAIRRTPRSSRQRSMARGSGPVSTTTAVPPLRRRARSRRPGRRRTSPSASPAVASPGDRTAGPRQRRAACSAVTVAAGLGQHARQQRPADRRRARSAPPAPAARPPIRGWPRRGLLRAGRR